MTVRLLILRSPKLTVRALIPVRRLLLDGVPLQLLASPQLPEKTQEKESTGRAIAAILGAAYDDLTCPCASTLLTGHGDRGV